MRIAFLHTADVHVATFDQIFDQLGVKAQLDHYVDADLLARARRDGLDVVRADVHAALIALTEADAVLCTCSTLGPLADEVAQSSKVSAVQKILRVDRPLMAQACAEGQNILVALCLESTRDATLDLLMDCAKQRAQTIEPTIVLCDAAWAHFEAGDMQAYAASIAESVQAKLAETSDIDCIVLAQASMRVAEPQLRQFGLPVHSSPVLAAQASIKRAQKNAQAQI